MKKLFAMLLSLTMLIGCTAALADTLTVGTNASWAPFEYIGDDGNPTGFDMDIAQEIANDLGMELKIEDMHFDGLLAALEAGTIDMLISAMTITDERKQQALFSEPYYVIEQAVIVLAGYDGIQTLEDIKDKKVAVQESTTGHFMAEDLGVDPSNISPFKAAPDTVLELINGRADCVIIDDAVAEAFLAQYDGLALVEDLDMPTEDYGIAVKMDNTELMDSINATLERIKSDGTYDALIEKYFSGDEEEVLVAN